MISPRLKLIVGIVVVSAALVFSLVLASQLGTSGQTGANKPAPWTPPPTFTPSPTATVPHGPENTPSPPPLPTSTLNPAKNCTRPLLYWADHAAEWPASVTIGDYVYTKATAIFALSQTGDTAASLLTQLNAAYLNAGNGADFNAVKDTILAAAAWLMAHSQDGSTPDPSELQDAQALQATLADYNEGRTGPGLCIETPTPTETSTSTATETATPTALPRQSATRTLLPSATSPGSIHPTRTFTPSPTARPTLAPSHTPTPLPQPTLTHTPLPTPTLAPTATTGPPPTSPPTATPGVPLTSPPTPVSEDAHVPLLGPRPILAPSTTAAHRQGPSPGAEAIRFSPPLLYTG